MSQICPAPARAAAALLSILLGSSSALGADLRLPEVFSSGMVLQQDAIVPIWGFTEPGAQVAVKGGWMPEWVAAEVVTADESGRWQANLQTPKADGKPTSVSIDGGGDRVSLDNVLLGEVWLCSGQSNMEWTLSRTIDAARKRGELTKDQTSLRPRKIRHFKVPPRFSMEPRVTSGGKWLDTEGDAAMSCTAAGYFFAMRLQEDMDVPVGLIDATWGGTPVQSWTSEEVVRKWKNHAAMIDQVRATAGQPEDSPERIESFWAAVSSADPSANGAEAVSFDDTGWKSVSVPSGFDALGAADFDGVVTYRTVVDVPKHWEGAELTLKMPGIDDLDETLWNGERVGSMISRGAWNKPRNYKVPGSAVKGGSAVLLVRAYDTGGRGGFGAGDMTLANGSEWIDLTSGDWRATVGAPASKMPSLPRSQTLNQHTPSALFNAMIAPQIPFKVQGCLWYQGESNRSYPDEYRQLFPAMIVDWRTRWDNLELPFYFVQIAPYNYGGEGKWLRMAAELRDAQAAATELPTTGMVLTADIGNPRDIHPKNKWEVGRRLALFALRDVYGKEGLEPDGPTFAGAAIEGSRMTLSFEHVGDRLSLRGERADHFELLGANGEWHDAEATISADGQSVVLTSPAVEAPTGARYLWTDKAEATVMGGTGLPMAPFQRTGLK